LRPEPARPGRINHTGPVQMKPPYLRANALSG
jgi:hypothetical protein